MRGETLPRSSQPSVRPGLSPRARGNLFTFFRTFLREGPIPACAGKPELEGGGYKLAAAYPRVRGETSTAASILFSTTGLSPRARGNPPPVSAVALARRPIPACAGKPAPRQGECGAVPAYPRVRGETSLTIRYITVSPGLSPRARGNRPPVRLGRKTRRPIPACAGKPARARKWGKIGFAYPRVRGETFFNLTSKLVDKGLSPRARGNRPP